MALQRHTERRNIRCANDISGSFSIRTRTDQLFADQPDQVRAEFHDRITAPLYPLAFVVMTYAYLGAPRTTRQGRTMSLLGAIGVVAALRGLGFVGMIAGVHTPIALVLPYIAADRELRAGISRDLARRDHRAPGFHHQCDHRDHGTHRSAHQRADGANAMIAGTLSRYFGLRFLTAVLAVFAGTLVLTAMIDFLELMRRTADIKRRLRASSSPRSRSFGCPSSPSA